MKMRKQASSALLATSLLVSACTSSGEFYDKSKHDEEDLDLGNTILFGIGAAAAAAAIMEAADGDGGGGSGSSYYDYDWDWDYQPANYQWVCRGIQTGRYAELYKCRYDIKDDDRWPG